MGGCTSPSNSTANNESRTNGFDSSAHNAFKAPEVVNITGSQGVQVGPTYHINGPVIHSRGLAQAIGSGGDPRPQREHVLQMLQVTRIVNEKDKSVVSDHLGDLWRSLGREMEFSNGQLDNIDNDNRRLQDKAYELLTAWHDDKSSQATFSQLTRLLMRVRAFEVVSRLYSSLET
ncbi:hypothetical protein HAZT_HAZT005466 [Hyalella azteca]|nr:hypothetical protein HAZT_HAZT005466 [Hyalella azteca]